MDSDLVSLRTQLDEIDEQWVALLARRFEVTHKVGLYKASHSLPAVDSAREEAQFLRIKELASAAGLEPAIAEKFLRLIIDTVVEKHKALQADPPR